MQFFTYYIQGFHESPKDIYNLKVAEPFKQLFTQGMITHKTYQDNMGNWIMPKDVYSERK